MARASRLALALLTLFGAACAEVGRAPDTARWPPETARAGGLAFTALRGRWPGYPPDLDRYYLPVETVIASERDEAVPVRLADFALVDQAGRERAPVAPREATTTLFGTYGRRSGLDQPGPLASPGALVAARTHFFFSGRFAYPFYYGPYAWGSAWPYAAPRQPTYEEATGDLLRYGLADGEIPPRGYVRGFLYFTADREGREPRELRLRWTAPGSGAPLLTAVVP